MIYEVYMLRDKLTGRWHNWGGLTEWLHPSVGGTIWSEKQPALDFAAKYNKSGAGVEVEVVTFLVPHGTAWTFDDMLPYMVKQSPWFVGALNDSLESSH